MRAPLIVEDLLLKYALRITDPLKEEPPLSGKPDEACIFAVQRDLDELDELLGRKVYCKLRETLENLAFFGVQDVKRSDVIAALRQGAAEVAELIKLDEDFGAITKSIE